VEQVQRHDEPPLALLLRLNALTIIAEIMSNEVSEAELIKVRDWANGQLSTEGEQPWSTFLLVRLTETIDALLAGRAATRAHGSSQAAASEHSVRLVVSNARQPFNKGEDSDG
jgi:hypothetical protein